MSVNFMQVMGGGICFAHGPYENAQCPQWPKCVVDLPQSEYIELAASQKDPTDAVVARLRELLEDDPIALRTFWNQHFPEKELERFANAYGYSFD